MIGVVVIWLAWSIMNGWIAREKNRNVTGVVAASLLLSPLLVWCYLLAVPALRSGIRPTTGHASRPEPLTDTWVCPQCRRTNSKGVRQCTYCGEK